MAARFSCRRRTLTTNTTKLFGLSLPLSP
jgi:hypothetical protein